MKAKGRPDSLVMMFRKAIKVAVRAGVGDTGLTKEDLCQALGVSDITVGKLLRQWKREGLLINGWRTIDGYRTDGRPARVPVYRLK